MAGSTSRWGDRSDVPRGVEYDERWARKAARGESVHGEADLVDSLIERGASVLDAGCGTGRVAVELARRGHEVVGVDLDSAMLEAARAKAPQDAWPNLTWIEGDLASPTVLWRKAPLQGSPLGLPRGPIRLFDAVVSAGNVMIFLARGSEAAVVANLAEHLRPGGLLVAGFQLSDGWLPLHVYDGLATRNSLQLEARYSTWERAPYVGGDYAVSVHRKAG